MDVKNRTGITAQLLNILSSHVSCGFRYMYKNKCNPELLIKSYDNLCETIRWKVFFESKPPGEKRKDPYDPEYDTGERTDTIAPKAPSYIEDGLSKGYEYVNDHVRFVVPRSKGPPSRDLVQTAEIEEILMTHNLILTPTDKNLGAAIITREWYLEGCRKLLDDQSNYLKLTRRERNSDLRKVIAAVRAFADRQCFAYHPQLRKFLTSKCPKSDDANKDLYAPRFYGIPKIHKNPGK